MPRYFLHVHDGFDAIDHEGVELPDLDAARAHAIQGLRSIVATEVLSGIVPRHESIVVADREGKKLIVVTFDDALEIVEHRAA